MRRGRNGVTRVANDGEFSTDRGSRGFASRPVSRKEERDGLSHCVVIKRLIILLAAHMCRASPDVRARVHTTS